MLTSICIGVLALGAYLFATYCQAKSHIGTAPKTEMFICPVHGAMPLDATMSIDTSNWEMLDELSGEPVTGKVPYCPHCFEMRIKEARKHYAPK